jgi:Fe2+ or Zn2+ uptake regulation protein
MADEQVYTVKEISTKLRISTATVYRNLKQWEHLRFGTEIRFTETQYQAILTKATKAPAQPAPHTKYGTRARRNK